MKLVLLKTFIDENGVTDIDQCVRDAKRFGCYFQRAGIVKIDVDKFQSKLDEEFAKAAEAASVAKTKTRGKGSDLGLVNARLAQSGDRRKSKLEKIASIKAAINSSKNAYERGKFKRDLAKAESELQRLEDGNTRDLKRRDEILNSESDDSDSAKEQM